MHAFCIKIDILNAVGDGRAALECIDQLVKVNEERWEKRRTLNRMIAQADAAIARGDENAEELMESVVEKVAESGLPAEVLVDDKKSQFGIELQRAEAYQVMKEWEEAKDVYIKMLMSMEGPEEASPPQNRQVFMGLSRCAYELGVYDKSIRAAEAALDMNRHFPGVHKYKALSEKASGDIDAAIRTMNRALLYETPWDDGNKAEVLKLYNELLSEKNGR
jgi:tetratricopeptide (TPR) repeat protein